MRSSVASGRVLAHSLAEMIAILVCKTYWLSFLSLVFFFGSKQTMVFKLHLNKNLSLIETKVITSIKYYLQNPPRRAMYM